MTRLSEAKVVGRQLLWLFPWVGLVGEVSVRSSLEVNRSSQVQFSDQDTWSKIEVFVDNGHKLIGRELGSSVGVDVDGQWLGNTNGVRELHQTSLSKTSGHQRLGNPSSSVCGGSVDLGEILTRESTTTVSSPSTIGVDNDLSSGQTSVSVRTTDDESTRWLDVVDGLIVQQVGWNHLLHNVFLDFGSKVSSRDLVSMLGRNDNSVDSQRHNSTAIVLVLDGDLGLSVRSEPWKSTGSSGISKSGVQFVGQQDGQWQLLIGLVGGVTEHDTLVTGTQLLQCLLVMQTLGNVWRLLLDSNKNITCFVVETLARVVVSNVLDSVSDDLLVVQSGLGGDFTKDHNHTSLGSGFTGHLRKRVCS
ncbi:hypothetical protein OGAPHI_007263 [Ogataea philodendri]|uniref:Secreted protein n=1 Tax=Ogataea philodendri TaxID=1378263 RepID=A0A9P8NUE8_9ASCO|nr:uncharacterized protein OGAPHI_007263 [Ogataea philodendri]KAH3660058.1 hypothetical protein OGAPHI_007263 [Ogataea philodendri]